MNFDELAYEWTPVQAKNYTITIRAWFTKGLQGITQDEWHWNVYAHIFESHPLFQDVNKAIQCLPFHGGVTYDQKITSEPAQGTRWDWQKVHTSLKIGCDYSHYGDEYFADCDPKEGVPLDIQDDVKALNEVLVNLIKKEDK